MRPGRRAITQSLLTLAEERGSEKTFCPSEAARRLAPDAWRECMPRIRAEALKLVKVGKLRANQRGDEVDPGSARGALRFSVPRHSKT